MDARELRKRRILEGSSARLAKLQTLQKEALHVEAHEEPCSPKRSSPAAVPAAIPPLPPSPPTTPSSSEEPEPQQDEQNTEPVDIELEPQNVALNFLVQGNPGLWLRCILMLIFFAAGVIYRLGFFSDSCVALTGVLHASCRLDVVRVCGLFWK
jgi:uncharacterized membrane protein